MSPVTPPERFPLFLGASGKAIQAFLDDPTRQDILAQRIVPELRRAGGAIGTRYPVAA